MNRRTWRRSFALTLGSAVLFAGSLAADDQPARKDAIPAPALRQLAEMRRSAGCLEAPTDDSALDLVLRGRPSIEIKGRRRSNSAAGTLCDLAVFDPAVGRIVSYICFTNASTRKSGEAIVSLAEASTRGDKLARALLPGSNLELESIKRYRKDGTVSIYYEARYASVAGDFPFLVPPVRLLLNATTGSLFRLDIVPDWLSPVDPPRARISRKAAEQIARVVLQNRDLAPAFGPGAVFGKVAAAEMFTVTPNDWLGFFTVAAGVRARVAWVVPFKVEGAAGLHQLFIDITTGRILGGLLDQSAEPPPR